MSKHTALIRLQAARRAYSEAVELCPHWDYESDGHVDGCCHDVVDALRKLKAARAAYDREQQIYA